jgi:hypothetical protein
VRPGEERDLAPGRASRRDEQASPETTALRDLQRRAGNRAVEALLGSPTAPPPRRSIAPAWLQRQEGGGVPRAEPAKDERTSGGGTMSIPALDLAIRVESVQLQPTRRGGRGREREGAPPDSNDVLVTIPLDAFDPRLANAAIEGRSFDEITITIGGRMTLTLRDVFLVNPTVGGGTVVLTLSATKIDFVSGG